MKKYLFVDAKEIERKTYMTNPTANNDDWDNYFITTGKETGVNVFKSLPKEYRKMIITVGKRIDKNLREGEEFLTENKFGVIKEDEKPKEIYGVTYNDSVFGYVHYTTANDYKKYKDVRNFFDELKEKGLTEEYANCIYELFREIRSIDKYNASLDKANGHTRNRKQWRQTVQVCFFNGIIVLKEDIIMINKIIEKLKNKKIAILGFGKEGLSSYKFIRQYLKDEEITIIDIKDKSKDEVFRDDENVSFKSGTYYLDDMEEYDIIIKTPGISLNDIDISKFKEKITSQLELLLEVAKDNIIGITGTKGKSTTSSLIYEVLKDQSLDVKLVGNIGVPVFDEIESYKEDTIIVVEMSSHQLEYIKKSPHIAIILNLYQDHLDHSKTVEHYHNSKMNIFKYQNEKDIGIYESDNESLNKLVRENDYQGILYDIRFDNSNGNERSIRIENGRVYINNELIYKDGDRKLIGDHYLNDIMFVATLSKIMNLDLTKVQETVHSFKGLKYRMELIGEFDGITFYNDTIATIPEATICAIKALKDVDTLIFGGMDRNIDYTRFMEYLKNSSISNFICMPTTGYKIGKELEKTRKNIFYVETLEEAYYIANVITEENKICLLSPAAASYEYFKNFEEKGKRFEKLVRER